MELKPGTVILWKEFKIPNYGEEVKPVLMLYLGRDSITEFSIFFHLHRFTGQIQHFRQYGDRDSSLAINYSKTQYTFFDDDCILNFNEHNYSIPKEYFENNFMKNNIEEIGELPEHELRRIFKLLKKAPHYNKKVITSIRESYNRFGITIK